MKRHLISERDVMDAARQGKKVIMIQSDFIITAAAQDEAKRRGIRFSLETDIAKNPGASTQPISSEKSSQTKSGEAITIALGADHGGFPMKEAVKQFLADEGYRIIDVGTDSENPCDYPDFAYAVASLVSSGKAERGIMIDSVGVASAIVGNKVPGVRAVPCYDEFVARSSREHNDANMLTLGSKILGIEMVKSIIRIWLVTPFAGGRHLTRINKISDVEKRFLK